MAKEDAAATELRAMRGAWRALRAEWDLDRREAMAVLAGDDEEPVLAAEPEARMRMLLEIGYRVDGRAGEGELRDRLRRPSATFGWLTPLEAMSGTVGELRRVRALLEAGAWS